MVNEPAFHLRINEQITAPTVQVIDAEGKQHGCMPRSVALNRARARGLDLVAVAPNARPPVCRIMDYTSFKDAHRDQGRCDAAEAN